MHAKIQQISSAYSSSSYFSPRLLLLFHPYFFFFIAILSQCICLCYLRWWWWRYHNCRLSWSLSLLLNLVLHPFLHTYFNICITKPSYSLKIRFALWTNSSKLSAIWLANLPLWSLAIVFRLAKSENKLVRAVRSNSSLRILSYCKFFISFHSFCPLKSTFILVQHIDIVTSLKPLKYNSIQLRWLIHIMWLVRCNKWNWYICNKLLW